MREIPSTWRWNKEQQMIHSWPSTEGKYWGENKGASALNIYRRLLVIMPYTKQQISTESLHCIRHYQQSKMTYRTWEDMYKFYTSIMLFLWGNWASVAFGSWKGKKVQRQISYRYLGTSVTSLASSKCNCNTITFMEIIYTKFRILVTSTYAGRE